MVASHGNAVGERIWDNVPSASRRRCPPSALYTWRKEISRQVVEVFAGHDTGLAPGALPPVKVEPYCILAPFQNLLEMLLPFYRTLVRQGSQRGSDRHLDLR